MILILDDHPLARAGLASVIRMYRPEEAMTQAGCVREAMAQMTEAAADMVFVDVNLGKESGFAFVEWLRESGFDTKVFFVTSSSRESDFLAARELGVNAYVLKDAFLDEILYGLRVVERGGTFYSPALVEQMNCDREEEQKLRRLTARELEVLELLSQAYSNGKISEALYISEATTKKHITGILSKLELGSRMEAMLFANNNRTITRAAVSRAVKKDRREGDLCKRTACGAAANGSR